MVSVRAARISGGWPRWMTSAATTMKVETCVESAAYSSSRPLGGQRAVEPVGDLRHAQHHHRGGEQRGQRQQPRGEAETGFEGEGRQAARYHWVSYVYL